MFYGFKLILRFFFRFFQQKGLTTKNSFAKVNNYFTENKIAVNLAVDLGCGDKPKKIIDSLVLAGLDMNPIESLVKECFLGFDPIPYNDNSVNLFTAFDFLEHIPRHSNIDGRFHNPFIFLMNEIYRTLEAGGLFYSKTPAFPGSVAFRDPTHVNIITSETFYLYFCEPNLYAKRYGFKGRFKIIQQGWDGEHFIAILQKVV
jgi:hypothetical protein